MWVSFSQLASKAYCTAVTYLQCNTTYHIYLVTPPLSNLHFSMRPKFKENANISNILPAGLEPATYGS